MNGPENKFYTTRGATHSFRLSPAACDWIDGLQDGRAKHAKGKGWWVSQAIVWFFTSPTYAYEYDEQGERTGRLVRAGKGAPHPVQLLDRVLELEQELREVSSSRQVADDEADNVPQSRGRSRIFHILSRFRL